MIDGITVNGLIGCASIATVFLTPELIIQLHARTNIFRKKYRIMNTRHMRNAQAYLDQFELIGSDGKLGYKKRPVGAKARARRYG